MVCCHLVSGELFIGLPVCCFCEIWFFDWCWSYGCFGWAGAPPVYCSLGMRYFVWRWCFGCCVLAVIPPWDGGFRGCCLSRGLGVWVGFLCWVAF